MFRLFFYIAVLFGPFIDGVARDRSEELVCLASYPRSGSHWTMYIIESLCHRAGFLAEAVVTGSVSRIGEDLGLEVVVKEGELDRSILKTHCLEKINRISVIFIVRNFKEAFVSHVMNHAHETLDPYRAIHMGITQDEVYFRNLEIFDKIDAAEKLLVYYEDLLDFPEREITRIVTFLSGTCDADAVRAFCDNISYHQQRGLLHYNYKKPLSYLQDHRRHTRGMSVESLRQLDTMVKTRYPDLWEKYLSRYAD